LEGCIRVHFSALNGSLFKFKQFTVVFLKKRVQKPLTKNKFSVRLSICCIEMPCRFPINVFPNYNS